MVWAEGSSLCAGGCFFSLSFGCPCIKSKNDQYDALQTDSANPGPRPLHTPSMMELGNFFNDRCGKT